MDATAEQAAQEDEKPTASEKGEEFGRGNETIWQQEEREREREREPKAAETTGPYHRYERARVSERERRRNKSWHTCE